MADSRDSRAPRSPRSILSFAIFIAIFANINAGTTATAQQCPASGGITTTFSDQDFDPGNWNDNFVVTSGNTGNSQTIDQETSGGYLDNLSWRQIVTSVLANSGDPSGVTSIYGFSFNAGATIDPATAVPVSLDYAEQYNLISGAGQM